MALGLDISVTCKLYTVALHGGCKTAPLIGHARHAWLEGEPRPPRATECAYPGLTEGPYPSSWVWSGLAPDHIWAPSKLFLLHQ